MSFEQQTLRGAYFAQQEKELAELIDPATGLLSEKYSRLIPCPLCRCKDFKPVFVKRGYSFVRCDECTLVYTNPQVIPELVESAYSGQKGRAASRTSELWMEILLQDAEVAWRTEYFNDIASRVEESLGGRKGQLLDVGCAVGHFLSICRDRGWQISGLELSEKGVRHCREKLGLDVQQKTFAEAAFPENRFDAVSLLGVLEHISEPMAVLSDAVHTLKKGGVLTIVVPNMYALYNMMLREKSVTYDGREHMIFFSMDTLRRAFSNLGLDVVLEDTMLTGIPNMVKYVQFYDPYGPDAGYRFIPEPMRSWLSTETGRKELESWILKNHLGLRLRMIGRKK